MCPSAAGELLSEVESGLEIVTWRGDEQPSVYHRRIYGIQKDKPLAILYIGVSKPALQGSSSVPT